MMHAAKRVGLASLAALVLLAARPALGVGIAKGPYMTAVTPTSIVVCWVSDNPAAGTVRYGEATAGPLADGKWQHEVAERSPVRYHRVKLTGLQPRTAYRYQVECEARYGAGSFTTAPRGDDPFHFVAYGDNRTQPEVHGAVVARIVRFAPDFVINTGDQVANGALEPLWTEFFDTAEPMLRAAPYYPELGNHEGEAAPYFQYFGPARYYSFDYGNAHFIALDSNLTGAEWTAEEKWLRKDLARSQKAAWRILFMHHPIHSCTAIPSRRTGAVELRARLEPLLRKYRVQLVVSGHDHNYQRHEANGITALISGGGGAPLYDLVPDTPFLKAWKKAYHECEMTVSGDTLDCRVVTPDGQTIDTFTLKAR